MSFKNRKLEIQERNAQFLRMIERLNCALQYYSGNIEGRYQRLLKGGSPSWRILRYERVTQPELHSYPIALKKYVRPKTFEMHLRYLLKHCSIVPLQALLNAIENRENIPPHTVALTFDNGWIDNFRFAFPLLQRYKVPATIFLATNYIGTVNTYWPEKLLQTIIGLHNAGKRLRDFPTIRNYFKDDVDWDDDSLRFAIARTSALIEALKFVEPVEHQLVFDELARAVEEIGSIPIERTFLTWEEVEIMSQANITFGTQGTSHALVSSFGPGDMAPDVLASIQKLREKKLDPVKAFVFPEGVVSKDARDTLQKMGVRFALGIGHYELPKEMSGSLLLGRVPMFEGVAFCREYFASRLWLGGFLDKDKSND